MFDLFIIQVWAVKQDSNQNISNQRECQIFKYLFQSSSLFFNNHIQPSILLWQAGMFNLFINLFIYNIFNCFNYFSKTLLNFVFLFSLNLQSTSWVTNTAIFHLIKNPSGPRYPRNLTIILCTFYEITTNKNFSSPSRASCSHFNQKDHNGMKFWRFLPKTAKFKNNLHPPNLKNFVIRQI